MNTRIDIETLSLKDVLSLCKEYGIKRLHSGSLTLEFLDKVKTEFHVKDAMGLGIQGLDKSEKMPTEDELMFAATEGLPKEE